MRVSPSELQAVQRGGMLTRYALFGPVTFVLADLPAGDATGTGLDRPCLVDHHGIVLAGSFSVHHDDGRSETFPEGTAFYIPPGPPTHTFAWAPRSVVGGFAPSPDEPPDLSPDALASHGYVVVERPQLPVTPPRSVALAGAVAPFRRPGAVDVEGSQMGPWLFMRARFGPRSGYTSGWCDLTHWGMVLDGEVAMQFGDRTELAARGDAYYAPPGHRFVSPDGATLADYTPISSLGSAGRVSRWRRATLERVPGLVSVVVPESAAIPEMARAQAVEGEGLPRLTVLRPGTVRD